MQRPFGIPELARDLFAGRPNHYDETAARWAQSRPVRPKEIRKYDEDERDEDNDDAIEIGLDPDEPCGPWDQPPSRGRKRAKQIREYDEDDYDDDDDDATEAGIDPDHPCCPSGQPSSKGRKRAHSQVSSIDSTLSAELELELGQPGPSTTEEALQELFKDERIARERLERGESSALEMAAAANTLQGGGRGLVGATGDVCMANDTVINRRQEELKRKRREEERLAAEPVEKKSREGDSGGGSGSGDAAPSGGVGRG